MAHIGGTPGEELIPTTVGAGAALLLARAAQTRIVLAAGSESEARWPIAVPVRWPTGWGSHR